MSFLNYFRSSMGKAPVSFLSWCGMFMSIIWVIVSCDTTESVTPNQGQNFIKLYGGNGTEEGKDLLQLADGGFILVGSSTSGSNGGKDVYVVRTDNLGNVVWESWYGGSGDDEANSVILGKNGSIYVCGEITQDSSVILGLRNVIVLNLNMGDGSLIGDPNQYGDPDRDELGTDIIELSNGGFFITSTALDADTSKYYLVETNSNLDTIPKKSRYIGTASVNNYSARSYELSDTENPFICFGSVYNTVNGQSSFWFRSFIYNSFKEGEINPNSYGTENNDEICTDVDQTTDGGYIMSGFVDNGGVNNEMLVKINSRRDEIWKRPYPNEFNKSVKGTGVIQTSDGGFMVSSTIELDDPKNDEISLLKLDSEGEEQWRKTYGSDDNDAGSKVIQLNDGSYVVIGTIGFEIYDKSKSKMCLLKVNQNGELVPLN